MHADDDHESVRSELARTGNQAIVACRSAVGNHRGLSPADRMPMGRGAMYAMSLSPLENLWI